MNFLIALSVCLCNTREENEDIPRRIKTKVDDFSLVGYLLLSGMVLDIKYKRKSLDEHQKPVHNQT